MSTPTSRGQRRGAPGDLPGYASGSDERGRRDRHIGQSAAPLNAGQPAVSARLHPASDALVMPKRGTRQWLAIQMLCRPEGVTILELSDRAAITLDNASAVMHGLRRGYGLTLVSEAVPDPRISGRRPYRYRLEPRVAERYRAAMAGDVAEVDRRLRACRPLPEIRPREPAQAQPAAPEPVHTVIERPRDRYELDPSAPLQGAGFAALAIGSYPAPLRPWTERTS